MAKRKSMDAAKPGIKRKLDESSATPAKRARQAESTPSAYVPSSAGTDRTFVTAQGGPTPSRTMIMDAGLSSDDEEETPRQSQKPPILELKGTKVKAPQPTPSKGSQREQDKPTPRSKKDSAFSEIAKAGKKNDAQTKSGKNLDTMIVVETAMEPSKKELEEKEALKAQRKAEKNARRRAARNGSAVVSVLPEPAESNDHPDWSLSLPSAGHFISQDPVFVQDQGNEYLLAATEIAVELLSLDTSLTIRSCPSPSGLSVKCFALAKATPNTVFIAYNNGAVHQWNWSKDGQANPFATAQGSLVAMDTSCSADGKEDLVYLSKSDNKTIVFFGEKSMYTTERQLESLQILGHGHYVVAHSKDVVVIGGRKSAGDSDVDYIWVELPISRSITCVGAKISQLTGDKKEQKRLPELSLAIGDVEGGIALYEQGIATLFRPKGNQNMATPRTLHWHREAVSSVKFSPDGNYLISGGNETVLVLWQLATGNKQFLPHLTSAIDRVVVSPNGTQYAVQLGDNSIMVLSTSELKPIANFARLQLCCRALSGGDDNKPTAAVLNPRDLNQLLLAVPSTQPKEPHHIEARPFLQTFDIRNSRHVTRQALGRNNVTDFNLGPESTPIIPPDVSHLQISSDGEWLATVDEWTPPASDMEHVSSEGNVDYQCRKRREVYLKIWQSSEEGIWTLTTRIDSPHALAGGERNGSGKVLALVSDPSGPGFASLGEDNTVRIWRPKARMQNGVVVTDASNNEVIEWVCKRTINLLSNAIPHPDTALVATGVLTPDSSASLAWSEDGSSIAASVQNLTSENNNSVVHILSVNGTVESKPSEVGQDSVVAMGFLGRYLITVSLQDARVVDLVQRRLYRRMKLSNAKEVLPLLAINHKEGNFAVAVGGRLMVYNPNESKSSIYNVDLGAPLAAVLANGAGYTLLSTHSTTRTLSRSGISQRLNELPTLEQEPSAPVEANSQMIVAEEVDVDEEEEISSELRRTLALPGDAEDDRPVVRPEQLASIFDVGHSFAMPPVKDMFQAIAGLFGRRPHKLVNKMAA
ncbi:WD40 repeat-like protein [Acrodontium crateriforme]|uniref:WD40 repeat-like protein n=1 Tax=Acrodontium crateriforme TaxID=150365 RepID=A0AAQ3R9A3_9PEZI|nr:WD40 repeat-like protein [Acrodontium crateriforme]